MQNLIYNIFDYLKSFWNAFSNINSTWGDITVIIVIALYIFFTIHFKNHVNKQSNKQICFLIKNGKYIPELYVELNHTEEQLRYFAHPSKWKKKLIRDFNNLFDNSASKKISDAIEDDLVIHLKRFSSYQTIQHTIEKDLEILERYRHGGYNKDGKIGEFFFIVEFSSFYYVNRLSILLEYCKIATQKSVIITGSAGNGKTNLLCEFSRMEILNNDVCAFVEAREVQSICSDYIKDRFFSKDLHISKIATALSIQNIC